MWTLDDVRFVFKNTWIREVLESKELLTHTVLAEKRNSSFPSFPQDFDLLAVHFFPSAHNLSLSLFQNTALRFQESIQQETVLRP